MTYRLRAADGTGLDVIATGAAITRLFVPDRSGTLLDVVLGLPSEDHYRVSNPAYLGVVVGPVAGRIGGGSFVLAGKSHQLQRNDGQNCLHSGEAGFHALHWQVDEQASDDHRLRLTIARAAGEGGFPGAVNASVIYHWTDTHQLVIDYEAAVDRPTPFNPTQHSYFNLSGHGCGDVLDHLLTVNASSYLPLTSSLLPRPPFESVENTPFDFRHATPLGKTLKMRHPQQDLAGGIDHDFCLDDMVVDDVENLQHAATLMSPRSGISLKVYTDRPSLHLFTANFGASKIAGKEGAVYGAHSGIALETQSFPDAPNQPSFPSITVTKERVFRSRTIFDFGVV